eukprot:GSMAST32.ASY1.ANO1.1409.1 assembled CDS
MSEIPIAEPVGSSYNPPKSTYPQSDPPQSVQETYQSRDLEDGTGRNVNNLANFTMATVRRGFVRKVFGILCAQLIVTFGMIAFLCAISCVERLPDTVLVAVGITVLIVFCLTLFACQSKIDFTMHGGILFSCLICLMIFGFICAVFVPSHKIGLLNTVYSSLGALLFSCYLVYDIQLIMGGKHKYALSPDEYVFAAINIYLDIINLFLYILSLLGDRR